MIVRIVGWTRIAQANLIQVHVGNLDTRAVDQLEDRVTHRRLAHTRRPAQPQEGNTSIRHRRQRSRDLARASWHPRAVVAQECLSLNLDCFTAAIATRIRRDWMPVLRS